MKFILILVLVSISGCSAFFSDIQLEENCFSPYSVKAEELFDLNDNEILYIEPLYGHGDTEIFYNKYDFKGFLLYQPKLIAANTIIDSAALVLFTGNIIKMWPSWGEYYIGDGRKHVSFEIIIQNEKYIFMGHLMPTEFIESMPARCNFDSM